MVATKEGVSDSRSIPAVGIHLGIVVTGFNQIPARHVLFHVVGVGTPVKAGFVVRHGASHLLSGKVIVIITAAGREGDTHAAH